MPSAQAQQLHDSPVLCSHILPRPALFQSTRRATSSPPLHKSSCKTTLINPVLVLQTYQLL